MAASPRGRLALAAACGAGLTLAQAPLFAWPLPFLCIPALAWLLFEAAPRRRAFHIGWAAGGGYFLTGLYWVAEAFFVDIARHGWMAPFAILGLAAGLGLFWGAAFWAARRIADRAPGWEKALTLAGCWTFLEYARAHVLTGFPWALPAYTWADLPVAQTASLFGPHTLGFLTVAFAVLPVSPWLEEADRPFRRAAGFAALAAAAVAGGWSWGLARLSATPEPAADAPVLRLVQPNAAQEAKWDPARYPLIFRRLADLSAPEPGRPAPDVVIWPETAVPWLLSRDDEARRIISEAGRGATVLLGARRIDEGPQGRSWRNALVALSPSGDILGAYDKRHLVPFGEYIPFHATLSRLGLGPMVGESGGFAPGTGPAILDLPGLPRLSPQICYETIFPHEMPGAGPGRPAWMVQITNDAWFGASTGPWQHYHQARMRAIEQGLPLARAANTGVSAIIDAMGRPVVRLGLLKAGAIQAPLPPALPPTLYARTGDLPWLAAPLLALLAGLVRRRAPRA